MNITARSTALAAALAVALTAGAGVVTLAQASGDTDAGRVGGPPLADWMSVADLAAQLEGQGYRVLEIEREQGVWEVEMLDTNGLRVEAYLDPVTGAPVQHRGDRD